MPRAEKGTPKYLANQMKSKGLQKLRWFCQVCQKQCRDDNGFKCHKESEGHVRMMLLVGERGGSYINSYSEQFRSAFVSLLSRRYGTQRVFANQVYQEYIQDKMHLHMNATRWVSLTQFCNTLARSGTIKLEETERGLWITWVDNSPKALARTEAMQKKERQDMDDEQREQKLIREQVERARKEAEDREDKANDGDGLQRDDAEKPIKLNLFNKPPTPPSDGDSVGDIIEETMTESTTADPKAESQPKATIAFGAPKTTAPRTNVFAAAKKSAKPVSKPADASAKPSSELSEMEKGLRLLDSNNKRNGSFAQRDPKRVRV